MGMNKLDSLRNAVEFLDQCRKDYNAGPTVALRDAVQWVEQAAREVLADMAITDYYRDQRSSGQTSAVQRTESELL